MAQEPLLRIASMFPSLDGEVNYWGQGTPTFFIRLAGCNLRCSYCDTAWAQDPNQGQLMTPSALLSILDYNRITKVTITGGEPLLQREALQLLLVLLSMQCINVTVETNGTQDPEPFMGHGAAFVVDIKLGQYTSAPLPPLGNFQHLGGHDWIKVVVGTPQDVEQAMQIWYGLVAKYYQHRRPGHRPRLALSPIWGSEMSPRQLADLIVQQHLPATLNLQMHKILWPEAGQGPEQEK